MVLMPAVEKLSLSEYGTPARGPLTFPDAISRAESKSGVMNALLPFVDFQLASQAATLRTACPRSDLIMMMEVNFDDVTVLDIGPSAAAGPYALQQDE